MKKILSLLTVVALLFTACKKDDADINPAPDANAGYGLQVNTNQADLGSRFEVLSEEISLVNQFKGTDDVLTFDKIGHLYPAGTNYSATSVDAYNDMVYVSFHVRGDVYGGEIVALDAQELINIGATGYPRPAGTNDVVLFSAEDVDMDFNDLMLGQERQYLYVAGGRNDVDGPYDDQPYPATVVRYVLDGMVPTGEISWETYLPASDANSVTRVTGGATNPGTVWMTSAGNTIDGHTGGLKVTYTTDPNPEEPILEYEVENGRHFAASDDYGVFLYSEGGVAMLDVYKLNNTTSPTYPEFLRTIALDADVTENGKNSLVIDGFWAYVALGDAGVRKVRIGQTPGFDSYTFPGKGDANAVDVDEDYVYIAYGQAGLIVLNKDMEFVGQYDEAGSFNFVDVKGDLIYLAVGVNNTNNKRDGGLLILEKE